MNHEENPIFDTSQTDHKSLEIFLEGIADSLLNIEDDLLSLDCDPTNQISINSLFRTIHTLKGNCHLCYMPDLGNFVHAIEESISGLRSTTLQYSPMLKEALLISFDQLTHYAESLLIGNEIDPQLLEEAADFYKSLSEATALDQDIIAIGIVRLLGGEAAEIVPLTYIPSSGGKTNEINVKFDNLDQQINNQLAFFCHLSCLLDNRNKRWNNRTFTLSKTVLDINKYLPEPLGEHQLEAAVYIHDLGVAFHNDAKLFVLNDFHLDADDDIKNHPHVAYQFLSLFPAWSEAAEIVLHHHERPDGKGYPQGLKADEICLGAKLLHLGIYFDGLIHERDENAHKRTLLRAITEVNAYESSHFDPAAIKAFNMSIKATYLRMKGTS